MKNNVQKHERKAVLLLISTIEAKGDMSYRSVLMRQLWRKSVESIATRGVP